MCIFRFKTRTEKSIKSLSEKVDKEISPKLDAAIRSDKDFLNRIIPNLKRNIKNNVDAIKNVRQDIRQLNDYYTKLHNKVCEMQEQLNRLDPMIPLTIKYCDKSNNPEPLVYAKEGDSGFDLRAYITENTDGAYYDKGVDKWCYVLKSGERKLFDTGKHFELSKYTELQVRPRSGMANKQGITVLNSPGTADEAFRGEIKVNLYNSSNQPVIIKSGDRIAQGVIMPVYNSHLVKLEKVDEIDTNTERGMDGHGSTGVQ